MEKSALKIFALLILLQLLPLGFKSHMCGPTDNPRICCCMEFFKHHGIVYGFNPGPLHRRERFIRFESTMAFCSSSFRLVPDFALFRPMPDMGENIFGPAKGSLLHSYQTAGYYNGKYINGLVTNTNYNDFVKFGLKEKFFKYANKNFDDQYKCLLMEGESHIQKYAEPWMSYDSHKNDWKFKGNLGDSTIPSLPQRGYDNCRFAFCMLDKIKESSPFNTVSGFYETKRQYCLAHSEYKDLTPVEDHSPTSKCTDDIPDTLCSNDFEFMTGREYCDYKEKGYVHHYKTCDGDCDERKCAVMKCRDSFQYNFCTKASVCMRETANFYDSYIDFCEEYPYLALRSASLDQGLNYYFPSVIECCDSNQGTYVCNEDNSYTPTPIECNTTTKEVFEKSFFLYEKDQPSCDNFRSCMEATDDQTNYCTDEGKFYETKKAFCIDNLANFEEKTFNDCSTDGSCPDRRKCSIQACHSRSQFNNKNTCSNTFHQIESEDDVCNYIDAFSFAEFLQCGEGNCGEEICQIRKSLEEKGREFQPFCTSDYTLVRDVDGITEDKEITFDIFNNNTCEGGCDKKGCFDMCVNHNIDRCKEECSPEDETCESECEDAPVAEECNSPCITFITSIFKCDGEESSLYSMEEAESICSQRMKDFPEVCTNCNEKNDCCVHECKEKFDAETFCTEKDFIFLNSEDTCRTRCENKDTSKMEVIYECNEGECLSQEDCNSEKCINHSGEFYAYCNSEYRVVNSFEALCEAYGNKEEIHTCQGDCKSIDCIVHKCMAQTELPNKQVCQFQDNFKFIDGFYETREDFCKAKIEEVMDNQERPTFDPENFDFTQFNLFSLDKKGKKTDCCMERCKQENEFFTPSCNKYDYVFHETVESYCLMSCKMEKDYPPVFCPSDSTEKCSSQRSCEKALCLDTFKDNYQTTCGQDGTLIDNVEDYCSQKVRGMNPFHCTEDCVEQDCFQKRCEQMTSHLDSNLCVRSSATGDTPLFFTNGSDFCSSIESANLESYFQASFSCPDCTGIPSCGQIESCESANYAVCDMRDRRLVSKTENCLMVLASVQVPLSSCLEGSDVRDCTPEDCCNHVPIAQISLIRETGVCDAHGHYSSSRNDLCKYQKVYSDFSDAVENFPTTFPLCANDFKTYYTPESFCLAKSENPSLEERKDGDRETYTQESCCEKKCADEYKPVVVRTVMEEYKAFNNICIASCHVRNAVPLHTCENTEGFYNVDDCSVEYCRIKNECSEEDKGYVCTYMGVEEITCPDKCPISSQYFRCGKEIEEGESTDPGYKSCKEVCYLFEI